MPTPFNKVITGLTLVPAGVSITGTVSVADGQRTMTGSGTLFTTELKKGNYLFIATDNIFVQIAEIFSDTQLRLVDPASKVVEAKEATQIQAKDVRFTSIGIAAVTGAASVNGVVVAEGLTVNHSVAESDMDRGARFLPPMYFTTVTSATLSGMIY